jgi:DNA-binding transcriptional ArsR family regulator
VSRGYGYVQRFVLAELDARSALGGGWVDARTLAACLVQDAPTTETRRSVRRALRLLAADGLVEIRLQPRVGYAARIATARIDEVATRRALRQRSDELRRQLSGLRPMPAAQARVARTRR